MFWGLIMEPNKRYTQTVDKSFHVSMASLDAATADNSIVQVMLCYDERNYLLCSLKKDVDWQVPLDLNFEEGTKIAFTSNGRGHVHLTGYLIPEEADDLDLDELEEAEEEEDDEVAPELVGSQPKRKANDSLKNNKKVKRLKAVSAEEDSSEDDEDNDLENDEEDEDEEDESLEIGKEVDDDSDDTEEDDDDDEDEEENDSEDDEEEEVQAKPQQNKNKQKEQQKQQKGVAKQEKPQKMVNGKNAKQEQTKQTTKKSKVEQQQPQQNNVQQQQGQKKRVIEGGVQVEDVKVGNGPPAKSGKFISVYYIGRLQNGKKFDSTMQGEGFKFRLGKGEVIKGWDVGIAGMKVGGKRKITIPPSYAYGAKGSPPVIPGNSTLIFEVELKKVH